MESYILKNMEKEEKVLLYQERNGYSFSPKNRCYRVEKITILNQGMVECILKDKVINRYNRLLQIIYNLVTSGNDESTSGDVLVTYTEIDRLRNILLNKYYRYLKREFIEEYLKKLHALEIQLKKVHVMELEQEIEVEEEKGRGR